MMDKAAVWLRVSGIICGHTGPKCVADRISLHGVTVTGGMKRSEPIGGAAKGMPL